MTTRISIIVRIEKLDSRGQSKQVWERRIIGENEFPSHLAQTELFHVAHAQLHPARPEPDKHHD